MAALLALAGCDTMSSLNPIDWWHQSEGGPIADARPPPPNADAPYPSLGSVPDKPVTNDAAARARIANALVADRANAQYDASLKPLVVPGTPPPAAPRPPPPPPGGEDASSATLAAASAPPPPPAPPKLSAVPRAAVQSAPLAAPALPQGAPAATPPEMPPAPPAPPVLPGVKQATAPTPPVPAPPPAPKPAAAPVAGAATPIAFAAGSAVLPSAAYPRLKALAQQRGGDTVAVVGFGGTADTSPAAQAAAMPLALARARAIAAYLETAGVPASAVRIDAEAVGQGGLARLTH